jgi:hypothetical protein
MAITALPSLDRTSSTFRTDTDTFFGTQLPVFSTQAEAARVEINANQVLVANNTATAVAAQVSSSSNAVTAVTAASAIQWASGTTYAVGDCRWSPTDMRVYRRKTAGAGTTDPNADPTNWGLVNPEPPVVIVSTTSYTAASNFHYVLTNAGLTTLNLPATPNAGDVVLCTVANQLRTNILARNGNYLMVNPATGAPLTEDMTLDTVSGTISVKYLNSTNGWRLV